MSCSERAARRAGFLVTVVLLAGTAACGVGAGTAEKAGTGAPAGRPADDMTRRLAQVEFDRQCTVASTSYADEAQFTTELDARLAEAGFTHEQWKRWHDALVDSPELVAQFAGISSAGCAGA